MYFSLCSISYITLRHGLRRSDLLFVNQEALLSAARNGGDFCPPPRGASAPNPKGDTFC